MLTINDEGGNFATRKGINEVFNIYVSTDVIIFLFCEVILVLNFDKSLQLWYDEQLVRRYYIIKL